MRLVSWDAAFSHRYDHWSAHMTEDVPFYVELAQQSTVRWASWLSATGGLPFLSLRQPVGQ